MPALYDCCINNITEPYMRSAVMAKTPFRLSGGPARSPQEHRTKYEMTE